MTTEVLLDASPFGARALTLREEIPVRLLHAFSTRSTPQLGQLVAAKAGRRDPRLGGQICDLGSLGKALLPVRDRARPEGSLFGAVVRREAEGHKMPLLSDKPSLRLPAATVGEGGDPRPGPMGLMEPEEGLPTLPQKPGAWDDTPPAVRLLTLASDKSTMAVVCSTGELAAQVAPYVPEGIALEVADGLPQLFDEAVDDALARTVPLDDGGSLVIDETEALTTVDVDLGTTSGQSKKGAGDKLRRQAVDALGASLSLRAIGGQVVLDLPRSAVRAPKMLRDQLTAVLKSDGLVSIPAVTKEGLVVLLFGKGRTSLLRDLTVEEGGDVRPGLNLTPELVAWRAWDQAIRDAEQDGARAPTVSLSPGAQACWDKAGASPAFQERFRLDPKLQIV